LGRFPKKWKVILAKLSWITLTIPANLAAIVQINVAVARNMVNEEKLNNNMGGTTSSRGTHSQQLEYGLHHCRGMGYCLLGGCCLGVAWPSQEGIAVAVGAGKEDYAGRVVILHAGQLQTVEMGLRGGFGLHFMSAKPVTWRFYLQGGYG
jgi:hypothetical protein